MDKNAVIVAMAKAMAIANQAEEGQPPEYWTEETLFSHGFYSDAERAYQAILDQGLVIQPRRTPPREPAEVLARALVRVFPAYRRITAGEASLQILDVLAETRHEVRHVVGLPRG